ncbi:hypothetical protein [Jiangella asiatica]|uniref:Uncharacterized protein n=1 Tax=Jiangella asiatica TaxID=2530372 RepID=A0A4R5C8C1_9ACTN|nr:hypothetical protein [Jiangella asiatica]TDD95019.1 hypothetical protein E1269_31500 [Jiangella asiatica]
MGPRYVLLGMITEGLTGRVRRLGWTSRFRRRGSITKTYTSTDGSRQFSVSATVTVQDASKSFNLDLDAAAEAVLCPPA